MSESGTSQDGKRPLRVALVTDWFAPRHGGIESQLKGLAQALARRGVAATVLTSFPGPAAVDGVQVVRLPVRLVPGAMVAWSPTLASMVEAALREGCFDVVHAHPSVVAPVCLAGVIAARRLDLPVVLTFHSSLRTLPFWLAALDGMTRWTRQGVTLAAVSDTVARQVQRIAPEAPVIVTPNGQDFAFWSAARPTPRPTGTLRIATAMRLERTKRPLALVKVLRRASDLLPGSDVRLELAAAGDGRFAGAVREAAARAGLEGRVEMPGWLGRDALRELYERSDVFLLPAAREAFGIAALEARTAGLPVLGRSGTGLADFIRPGRDGVLADGDEGLARALAELALDRSRLALLSGPRPELARYRWDAVAASHERVYRTALSRSRSPGPA